MVISTGQMKVRAGVIRSGRPCETWYVDSETDPNQKPYIVHHRRNTVSHRKAWTCNCLDFTERRVVTTGASCKHIRAVKDIVLGEQLASQAKEVLKEVQSGVPAVLASAVAAVPAIPEATFPIPPVSSVRLACRHQICRAEYPSFPGQTVENFFHCHMLANPNGIADLSTGIVYKTFKDFEAGQGTLKNPCADINIPAAPVRLQCAFADCAKPVYPNNPGQTPEEFFARHVRTLSGVRDLNSNKVYASFEAWRIDQIAAEPVVPTVAVAEPTPATEPVVEPAPATEPVAKLPVAVAGYLPEPRLRCNWCAERGNESLFPTPSYPTTDAFFLQHGGMSITDLKTGKTSNLHKEEFLQVLTAEEEDGCQDTR